MKKILVSIFCLFFISLNVFAARQKNVGPTEQLLLISATNYLYLADSADKTFFYLDKDSNGNRTVFTIGNRTGEVGDYSFAFGEFPIAAGLFSHAEGFFPKATNDYSYVWNGDTSKINYGSHGIGTYSVNPVDGLRGFYIGDHNLYDYIITNAITLLVQSDWAVTETNNLAYIKNKPTNVSEFENDANYITVEGVPDGQVQSDWTATETIPVEVEEGEEPQTKPNPAYILNKPTEISEFNNDAGYIVGSQVPTYQTNADWNAQEFKFDSDGNSIYVTNAEGHLVQERNPSFIKNKPTFVSKFKNDRGYISLLNGVEPKFDEGINILTLKAPQAAGGQTSTDIYIPKFPTNLSELNDVDLSETVENGQLLTYRDGNWTNETLTIPQPTTTLSALTDVDLAESIEAGQVLTYDAEARKWTNAPASGGNEVSWTQVSFENGTKIAEIQIDNNEPIEVCIPNTNAYVQKSGDTMTGTLINSVGIAVGEGVSVGENTNVFVFNGDNSTTYSSQADGTFNVNPTNGLQGFNIGSSNLYQYVFERMLNIYLSKDYSQSRNVNQLIENEKQLWDLIRDYSNYYNDQDVRESNDESMLLNRDGELLGGTFQQWGPDDPRPGQPGPYPVVAYTFHSWGNKIINVGSDSESYSGNANIIGDAILDLSADAKAPPNSVSKSLRIDAHDEGYDTQSGACSDQYDPMSRASKFTIMAWVRRSANESADTAARIIANLTGTTNGKGFQWRFGKSTSGTQMQLFVNPQDSSQVAQSGQIRIKDDVTGENYLPLNPGDTNWYHIAVSYDSTKTSANVIFYVHDTKNTNFFRVARTYANQGSVSQNKASFWVGCSSGGNTKDGQYEGYIDDILIFKDWTPEDTTVYENDYEAVEWWMNQDDNIFPTPSIRDPIEFGEFNPNEKIYSADQINQMLEPASPPEAQTFGEMDPETEIYSSDQIDQLIIQ